jgi:hypothetical protein
MEKEQRNRLQKATQDARKLLEEEFRSQLLQTYDIEVDKVRWAEEPGAHLLAEQRLIREKLIAWIEHKEAQINDRKEALLLALREMAFTALNRFVALKLMEARELVRPCVSGGLESAGFLEFSAVAQGLLADQESSYRLYMETIFEDVSRELRALFDPRDPASLIWPKRTALLELLEILNRPELAELWGEDETLGWVYQYFNGDAERKKMREESSAPRNSRELAVRNQFFTPRYVVEFLTDNTLGRIWYEMRQGNTGIKDRCRYLVRRPNEIWLQPGEEPPVQLDAEETLSQEELLRQQVYIPHRPLKDPREIRMLDPACGSMHFGLYAFDLYLAIYEEAWEITKGSGELATRDEAFAPFVDYAAGFADKAAFMREVPRLILLHNIHGVDIDSRATQIAKLTLWLRAQRAWLKQQLRVADRPTITRSNVVCAEPMPGERELLADFVDQQFAEAERPLLRQLLEAVFTQMQLAGEAGSLLRIEEEIRDAIEQAQRDWRKLAVQQQNLFHHGELAALGQAGTSASNGLENLKKDFWINIEERIYTALSDYASHAESGGYQRRLFANDAARGFAFIDVCRRRYDAVLMNPPFGLASKASEKYLRSTYVSSGSDELAASFFTRILEMLSKGGRLGEISSRTFFFAYAFSEWRDKVLLSGSSLNVFADLGTGVLDDAHNEVTAYVAQGGADAVRQSCFFMLHREADTKEALERSCGLSSEFKVYIKRLDDFLALEDRPLCYWVSDSFRDSIASLSCMGKGAADVQMGLAPRDEFRFSRAWWEIRPTEVGRSRHWIPYAKGGEMSSYYCDIDLVLNSKDELSEIKAALNHKYPYLKGNLDWVLHPENNYFEPGLTFGERTSFLRMSTLPRDCYFSVSGKAIFGRGQSSLSLLQAINTPSAQFLTYLRRGSLSMNPKFQEGDVSRLPWPRLAPDTITMLEELARQSYAWVKKVASLDETDHAFLRPANGEWVHGLLKEAVESIQHNENISDCVLRDSLCLSASDQEFIETEIIPGWKSRTSANWHDASDRDGYISYLLGLVFGRWDARISIRKGWDSLSRDPFAAVSPTSPGMLRDRNHTPIMAESALELSQEQRYPLEIAWPGILVTDPGHSHDIADCVQRSSEAELLLNGYSSEITDGRSWPSPEISELISLFERPSGFFADHLKRYSKSRRQAPIYWQLSVGSCSYCVWLYYHRFTQDTLYRVLRDYVEPRIQQAEREQFEMESQGTLSGDAATRLQVAQTLLQDLRMFKSELDLVAPLWNPNLNDGVIINHAILWRITPYTPWQKKCKECWDKLVKGDYDWAHLAFHLWPERVIPKCTTDRSLAIAHGLEDRLWQETNNGNWLPRQLSEADLQTLIAEHSNPAVKSALERFLAAPPPVAPTRTRASRSKRASGSSAPRRPRGSAAVVDAEATRQVLLALTAAPSDGLAKAAIADRIGVEANALTAVIKQLKESGQIDQLGERRGARYVLSDQGRARLKQEEAG